MSNTQPYNIVRKRKYDGSIKSEWEGDLLPLPSNEWFIVLHHPERHQKLSNGDSDLSSRSADSNVEPYETLFLHCINLIRPLTVLMEYDLGGRFMGAKCDAALPATRINKVIEFVDLDLDVIVASVLSHHVRDQADFAKRRETMDYPEHVVQQAHSGISLAQALVASRQFPFDERLVPRLNIDTAPTKL